MLVFEEVIHHCYRGEKEIRVMDPQHQIPPFVHHQLPSIWSQIQTYSTIGQMNPLLRGFISGTLKLHGATTSTECAVPGGHLVGCQLLVNRVGVCLDLTLVDVFSHIHWGKRDS